MVLQRETVLCFGDRWRQQHAERCAAAADAAAVTWLATAGMQHAPVASRMPCVAPLPRHVRLLVLLLQTLRVAAVPTGYTATTKSPPTTWEHRSTTSTQSRCGSLQHSAAPAAVAAGGPVHTTLLLLGPVADPAAAAAAAAPQRAAGRSPSMQTSWRGCWMLMRWSVCSRLMVRQLLYLLMLALLLASSWFAVALVLLATARQAARLGLQQSSSDQVRGQV